MAKPVVVHLGPDRLVSLKVEQLEKENAMLEAQERAEDFAMEGK